MRHGWNSLDRYLQIHETIIRQYHRHMVDPKIYTLAERTSQWFILSCENICLRTKRGSIIRVDIVKDIEVDDSVPNRRRARTFGYKYNANIPGIGNILRYCGPHSDVDPDEAPDHHRFHHKHVFAGGKEKIIRLEDDTWPHVNEFLDEVLDSF